MCIRNRGHDLGSASNSKNSVIQHPIRKIRTKTRRPKFLSLRLELIPPRNSTPMTTRPKPLPTPPPPQKQQQQLTLFPLHPENMVEDRDENVALMFNSADVGSSCCSLQSLSFLPDYQNDMSSTTEEEESRNLVEAEGGSWLVRAAMRSREREAAAEEKWVCYSEVVEKKDEEVTSTAAEKKKKKKNGKQLRLKLDYEGILNAWSDKAPLYINGESPQTVPNLHDDQILRSDSLPNRCGMGVGSEGNNNVWKVPEMGALEGKEGCKMGQREASVLRYKEKRQSRLFSKRIRYQVRKLNAEKRPRMKGRFVKRS